jgi:hypothetical protein
MNGITPDDGVMVMIGYHEKIAAITSDGINVATQIA